ncbi:MAG: DUF4162 domain-containing protein, partial [Planctomycetota bacterium]
SSRRQLWEIIEDFKKNNKSVLLTTHYMEEAERLCDRVAIFDSGKIIAEGTPNELIGSLGAEHVILITLKRNFDRQEMNWIEDIPTVAQVEKAGKELKITVEQPHVVLPGLMSGLSESGWELASLTTRHASLEDVFVHLTGRHLTERED